MSIIAKAMPARDPKTPESQRVAYMYAFILVVFILCQLFTYNDFLKLLDSFLIPGGVMTTHILGSIIVVCEVMALPFLLRMRLSHLMRIVCMVMGWLVPLIWLGLALWLNLTVNAVSNVGFFGTTVSLMPGWWAVFFSIALGLLAAWVSWGLWPFNPRRANKKVKGN